MTIKRPGKNALKGLALWSEFGVSLESLRMIVCIKPGMASPFVIQKSGEL